MDSSTDSLVTRDSIDDRDSTFHQEDFFSNRDNQENWLMDEFSNRVNSMRNS